MGLKVTQRRSAIGVRPVHRGTLRALGLGRIGKSHVLPDRPEIRGMIATVPHLVEVEEVAEEPTPRTRVRARAGAAQPATAQPDDDKGQA
jgi:large subunit ribosomal protein L30